MVSSKKAEFNLLLVSAIWGLTFPLVGVAVKSMAPMYFVTLRFLLAAVIMLPFLWRELSKTNTTTLGYGALLGLANLGCYWFQGLGLKTLGSAESAFITSTTVIIVPVVLLLFRHFKPTFMDFLSSILGVIGLYILTGANLAALHRGELFTLLCAFSCALSIIITQLATHKICHFKLLVFYQIVFTALLSMPLSVAQSERLIFNREIIFALLYCSIFATIVVFYLQVKYQKYTSASKAALIFCMEPIFATFYSWIIFSEEVTLNILIGGIILLASIALPDILKLTVKMAEES